MNEKEELELNNAAERVLWALREFLLIRRELEWYMNHEPHVYNELREKVKEAIRGNHR